MALSGSVRGSSSLRATEDRNKLDRNFANEAYSPEFEAYMSTDIGRAQTTNYDNFYMNGVYSNMNIAKTNYHITGRSKKAVFAVCRGIGDEDRAFEASRRAFEYLDEKREEILNARTIIGIKKNLLTFAEDCNAILKNDIKYSGSSVSLMVIVYAFSKAVVLNCGDCSLFKIDKSNNCKAISEIGDYLGTGNKFNVKAVNYFLSSRLMMTTQSGMAEKTDRNGFALVGNGMKEEAMGIMSKLRIQNPERNHTCMIISENGSKTIMASTNWTAVACAVVTVISVINMLIQSASAV